MELEPKPSSTPANKTSQTNDLPKKERKASVDHQNVAMWIKVVCGILVLVVGYLGYIFNSKKSDEEQFRNSLAEIRKSNENVRLSPVTCAPITAKFASMSDQRRYEIISHCTDCMRIDKRSNVGTAPELVEISLQFLNLGNYEECEHLLKLARERNHSKFIEFECQELLIRLYTTRGEFDKADKTINDMQQKLIRDDSLSDGECLVRKLRLMYCKALTEYVRNPYASKPSKTLLDAIKTSEQLVPLPDVYQIQGYLYALHSLYPEETTYAVEEAPSLNRVKTLKPTIYPDLVPEVKKAPAPSPRPTRRN
ncbi:hypothetical protein [Gimesia aquarii]|uniref:Uncharacterized protein n=1 Tax=Gimesia aquarii TaxID=2527964 RepID=A0A517WW63_9PLAN|nr:hypothetical protein [Gimesia aquarii]QDU09469.1 hypothetical protein V202x_28440 [Gimesia aquarii]